MKSITTGGADSLHISNDYWVKKGQKHLQEKRDHLQQVKDKNFEIRSLKD